VIDRRCVTGQQQRHKGFWTQLVIGVFHMPSLDTQDSIMANREDVTWWTCSGTAVWRPDCRTKNSCAGSLPRWQGEGTNYNERTSQRWVTRSKMNSHDIDSVLHNSLVMSRPVLCLVYPGFESLLQTCYPDWSRPISIWFCLQQNFSSLQNEESLKYYYLLSYVRNGKT
jgi:hypothetical protein